MNTDYHSQYSHHLGRNMEYKVYGHTGKPVLVFPTSGGRFFQYEDFGMISTISDYIENGMIQVWACDGIDHETFLSGGNPCERIQRHEAYFRYITDELIPLIRSRNNSDNNGFEHQLLVTGCSLGAYHSANMFFRFPWHFDSLIALSGVYSNEYFFGDYSDEAVYLNSPIHYLANLEDRNYLDKYRQSKIYICCGQGSYEERILGDTLRIRDVLNTKDTGAWIDIWGKDVNHDWPWWRKQIRYFLDNYFTSAHN